MSFGDVMYCLAHLSRLAAKCIAQAARKFCGKLSKSGDKVNNGNNPRAGLDGRNMPNGGEDTLAQTTQPLLLDQKASLDAGISARVMNQSWSLLLIGKNVSPSINYIVQAAEITW